MPELEPLLIVRFSLIGATLFIAISAILSLFSTRKSIFTIYFAFVFLLLFFLIRAYLKNFFPFTDKIESFITLSTLLLICGLLYRKRVTKFEFSAVIFLALFSAVTVYIFNDHIRYPTPYLRTVWYPLHVPLSFASYAFWFLAGIVSISGLKKNQGPSRSVQIQGLQQELNTFGFVFFTISMIFGGIWGYLAWGAYFLWDPKLLWAVILWFFYGNLLHIDGLPKFRKWRSPLYLTGIVLILITFIGTGFFSRSIHKF